MDWDYTTPPDNLLQHLTVLTVENINLLSIPHFPCCRFLALASGAFAVLFWEETTPVVKVGWEMTAVVSLLTLLFLRFSKYSSQLVPQGHVLHSPYLGGPPRGSLYYTNVFLILGNPKLGAVFQMLSHKWLTIGDTNFPQTGNYTPLMWHRVQSTFIATRVCCQIVLSLLSTMTSRSFSAKLLFRQLTPGYPATNSHSFSSTWPQYLPLLNYRSFYRIMEWFLQPIDIPQNGSLTLPPSFLSATKLPRGHSQCLGCQER